MENILIVSEKPSVGMAIASSLKVKETARHNGYIEGRSEIYGMNIWVTWCVGHLVEMYAPDQYDPRYSRWSYENLPILPSEYCCAPFSMTGYGFMKLSRYEQETIVNLSEK